MARGWGRSEEDLPADKEQARESQPASRSPEEVERLRKRRSIQLSLARIEEQLTLVSYPERRKALETARRDLLQSLAKL
jgi:hypothetical protein